MVHTAFFVGEGGMSLLSPLPPWGTIVDSDIFLLLFHPWGDMGSTFYLSSLLRTSVVLNAVFSLICNFVLTFRGKYTVNTHSSEEDVDQGTGSRPNSVYSEDSKESKETTDSGGTPSTTTLSSTVVGGDGDCSENAATVSMMDNGGGYSGTKVTLISKKKGLVVNPDYV